MNKIGIFESIELAFSAGATPAEEEVLTTRLLCLKKSSLKFISSNRSLLFMCNHFPITMILFCK